MLEPRDYFRNWGPWGWIWALGLLAFLVGLFLTPLVLAGSAPVPVLSVSLMGGALMWGSARSAVEAFL